MWVGASSTGLGGWGTRLRLRKLCHSQIQKTQGWISKEWGELQYKILQDRGEWEDAALFWLVVFLLLFWGSFLSCLPMRLSKKYSKTDSDSVGQLRDHSQTCMQRPTSWGTNSIHTIAQKLLTWLICSSISSYDIIFAVFWKAVNCILGTHSSFKAG